MNSLRKIKKKIKLRTKDEHSQLSLAATNFRKYCDFDTKHDKAEDFLVANSSFMTIIFYATL